MRLTILVLLFDLAFAGTARAEPTPLPSWSHTRALTRGAAELLRATAERSAIVTSLLAVIERSNLIVYLTDAGPSGAGGPKSHLGFLSLDSTTRYLLIRIDRWRLGPPEAMVALGHELQHAVEVSQAPEVTNAAALVELYRRIGWEGERDRFETEAARVISNRVRSQLFTSALAASPATRWSEAREAASTTLPRAPVSR